MRRLLELVCVLLLPLLPSGLLLLRSHGGDPESTNSAHGDPGTTEDSTFPDADPAMVDHDTIAMERTPLNQDSSSSFHVALDHQNTTSRGDEPGNNASATRMNVARNDHQRRTQVVPGCVGLACGGAVLLAFYYSGWVLYCGGSTNVTEGTSIFSTSRYPGVDLAGDRAASTTLAGPRWWSTPIDGAGDHTSSRTAGTTDDEDTKGHSSALSYAAPSTTVPYASSSSSSAALQPPKPVAVPEQATTSPWWKLTSSTLSPDDRRKEVSFENPLERLARLSDGPVDNELFEAMWSSVFPKNNLLDFFNTAAERALMVEDASTRAEVSKKPAPGGGTTTGTTQRRLLGRSSDVPHAKISRPKRFLSHVPRSERASDHLHGWDNQEDGGRDSAKEFSVVRQSPFEAASAAGEDPLQGTNAVPPPPSGHPYRRFFESLPWQFDSANHLNSILPSDWIQEIVPLWKGQVMKNFWRKATADLEDWKHFALGHEEQTAGNEDAVEKISRATSKPGRSSADVTSVVEKSIFEHTVLPLLQKERTNSYKKWYLKHLNLSPKPDFALAFLLTGFGYGSPGVGFVPRTGDTEPAVEWNVEMTEKPEEFVSWFESWFWRQLDVKRRALNEDRDLSRLRKHGMDHIDYYRTRDLLAMMQQTYEATLLDLQTAIRTELDRLYPLLIQELTGTYFYDAQAATALAAYLLISSTSATPSSSSVGVERRMTGEADDPAVGDGSFPTIFPAMPVLKKQTNLAGKTAYYFKNGNVGVFGGLTLNSGLEEVKPSESDELYRLKELGHSREQENGKGIYTQPYCLMEKLFRRVAPNPDVSLDAQFNKMLQTYSFKVSIKAEKDLVIRHEFTIVKTPAEQFYIFDAANFNEFRGKGSMATDWEHEETVPDPTASSTATDPSEAGAVAAEKKWRLRKEYLPPKLRYLSQDVVEKLLCSKYLLYMDEDLLTTATTSESIEMANESNKESTARAGKMDYLQKKIHDELKDWEIDQMYLKSTRTAGETEERNTGQSSGLADEGRRGMPPFPDDPATKQLDIISMTQMLEFKDTWRKYVFRDAWSKQLTDEPGYGLPILQAVWKMEME
ncbi:unnamed protein product [Amoebophrya sp. A120]|nr:unnamed protein product [Amoebophrya sp. A120]|eukprot:GSA120T00025511001.1